VDRGPGRREHSSFLKRGGSPDGGKKDDAHHDKPGKKKMATISRGGKKRNLRKETGMAIASKCTGEGRAPLKGPDVQNAKRLPKKGKLRTKKSSGKKKKGKFPSGKVLNIEKSLIGGSTNERLSLGGIWRGKREVDLPQWRKCLLLFHPLAEKGNTRTLK